MTDKDEKLTLLQTPGLFDASRIILDDMRDAARKALLAGKLGQINAPRMTATEVRERAAKMARRRAYWLDYKVFPPGMKSCLFDRSPDCDTEKND